MKKMLAIVVLLMLLLAGTIAAQASWIAPTPFSVYSQDGRRVFQFEPNSWEDLAPDEQMTATISLYEDDEVIYVVDDFRFLAFESSFVFSDCLNYFAFFYPDTFTYALAFYENGQLIRRYRVDELMRRMPRFSTSVGHFWENHDARTFDPEINLLTVTTVDRQTHVFDITTGELVETNAPLQWWAWAAISGIVILAAALVYVIIRHRKT